MFSLFGKSSAAAAAAPAPAPAEPKDDSPKGQVRAWQKELRAEMRNLDRQVRGELQFACFSLVVHGLFLCFFACPTAHTHCLSSLGYSTTLLPTVHSGSRLPSPHSPVSHRLALLPRMFRSGVTGRAPGECAVV